MEKFINEKAVSPLKGEVQISGAKNAAVAIIPAAILAADKCVLENVPSISDVEVALEILSSMGAEIKRLSKSKIEVDTSRITDGTVPYDLARSTRGSSYFLGALLGRFKKRSAFPLPPAVATWEADLSISISSVLRRLALRLISSTE